MQQDQRIGLALGVLLVGACAALFFRNETREIPNVPRLNHAQELDDRIAERSNRPYLRGIEAVETSDRSRFRSESDGQNSPFGPHFDKSSSRDEALDHELASDTRSRKPRARLTDPELDIQELAPIPVPTDAVQEQSRQSERIDGGHLAGRQPRTVNDSASDGQTHVVQKGDTLSSIATKFLGNPGRFHEIFDANRDQLNDANDVRLGMTLRIPNLHAGSVVRPHTTAVSPSYESESSNEVRPPMPLDSLSNAEPPAFSGRSLTPRSNDETARSILMPPDLPVELRLEVPSDSANDDEAPSTRKFVPARRLPPPMRNIGPQSKANSRPEFAGRKLSQASAESASSKVAR